MSKPTMIKIKKSKNAVAIITINRPEVRNALDEMVIAELTMAYIALSQAEDVRVIVLQGEGKLFCAGADIAWMRRMSGNSFEDNLSDARKLAGLFDAIARCPKPTIALVHGGAYGGGVGLVAACDIAIADDEAAFMLSEVKLGIIPAVISPYLVDAIGARQAKRLTLTAEKFTAEEAFHLGLVHQVVPFDEVEAVAETIVSKLLNGSSQAQAASKELFARVTSMPINNETHEYTSMMIANARSSRDGIEGLQSFLSKRLPAWMQNDDQ